MKIKARKVPVEVECVQFTDKESAEYIEEWTGAQAIYCESKYYNFLVVRTLEGEMNATINDYIVKGVNGEFYPVKPDIFHKTYEVLKDEK
ncbi:hypothetical protein RCF73_03005 [Staphylococcus chromogenes]|uniref:hypothetical protein n=1 Tax=Staphylococcus chromogenes TaxID=46126 RepID=UPI003B00C3DF